MHGYQRNTVDVDLIIRPEDSDGVRSLLQENGFSWNPKVVEFTFRQLVRNARFDEE